MKRPLFTIIGAVIVLILIIVWLYILLFNTPESNKDSFADLNLGDTTDTSININTNKKDPAVNISETKSLKQLTTKNTIGYQEVSEDASSTPKIFYTEAGTGHIFSIDMSSGKESQISKTTIPHSKESAITPNGFFVLTQSNLGPSSTFIVGEISSTSPELSTTNLEENILSFTSTRDNTFLYAVQKSDSVVAYEYLPLSNKANMLFTIPFREASIVWGDTDVDTHLFYPKASSALDGFLYSVTKGKISRIPISGYGLSASGNDSFITYSKQVAGKYQSFIRNTTTNISAPFGLTTLPEKCVYSNIENSTSVCAITITDYGSDSPDSWYKGEVSYKDDLWQLDSESISSTLLVDTLTNSGRELDIINLSLGRNDSSVYFINKNDSTLWVYTLTENQVNN